MNEDVHHFPFPEVETFKTYRSEGFHLIKEEHETFADFRNKLHQCTFVTFFIHGLVSSSKIWEDFELDDPVYQKSCKLYLDYVQDDTFIRKAKRISALLKYVDKQIILFVGHSQGGLFIKEILSETNQDPLAVIFYFTPHFGSDAKRWLWLASFFINVGELELGNSYLSNLDRKIENKKFNCYNVQEKDDKVPTYASQTNYKHTINFHCDSDHSDILGCLPKLNNLFNLDKYATEAIMRSTGQFGSSRLIRIQEQRLQDFMETNSATLIPRARGDIPNTKKFGELLKQSKAKKEKDL